MIFTFLGPGPRPGPGSQGPWCENTMQILRNRYDKMWFGTFTCVACLFHITFTFGGLGPRSEPQLSYCFHTSGHITFMFLCTPDLGPISIRSLWNAWPGYACAVSKVQQASKARRIFGLHCLAQRVWDLLQLCKSFLSRLQQPRLDLEDVRLLVQPVSP